MTGEILPKPLKRKIKHKKGDETENGKEPRKVQKGDETHEEEDGKEKANKPIRENYNYEEGNKTRGEDEGNKKTNKTDNKANRAACGKLHEQGFQAKLQTRTSRN